MSRVVRRATLENAGAGDQHIRPGLGHLRRCPRRDAAINLNVDRPVPDHGAQAADLVEL